jgi:hypothetical protein
MDVWVGGRGERREVVCYWVAESQEGGQRLMERVGLVRKTDWSECLSFANDDYQSFRSPLDSKTHILLP